jgi:hypothetical protein
VKTILIIFLDGKNATVSLYPMKFSVSYSPALPYQKHNFCQNMLIFGRNIQDVASNYP